MPRKPVKELYVSALSVDPVWKDWRASNPQTGENDWEAWEPREKGEDGERVANEYPEGPMMNYYYGLPGFQPSDPQEEAGKLDGLPLCLVCLSEEMDLDSIDNGPIYALALTGGGMDLTWEIAEGYMRLGYLPPLHFCNLPSFAGMKYSERVCWILAGCKRSCKIARIHAQGQARDIEVVRAWLKRQAQPIAEA